MSEQINIDELERLAQAATPGPWESEVVEDVHAIAWVGKIGVFAADGRPHRDWAEVENDSSFIAAANPATVLALISQLRALGDRAMHLERRLSDANGEVLRLQGAERHALQLQAGHDEAVMRAQALEQERDALATRLEVIPGGGPDGIECRDATIKLQDARIAELEAQLKELEGHDPIPVGEVTHSDVLPDASGMYRHELLCSFRLGMQTELYARPVPAEPANARLVAAAKAALDALTCSSDPDDPGHRCGHCDDYVDRNGVVRSALRDAIAAAEAQQSDQVARPALMTIEQARDSERYAYLRSQHEGSVAASFAVFAPEQPIGEFGPVGSMPGELDAAIDAAIRANGYKVEG